MKNYNKVFEIGEGKNGDYYYRRINDKKNIYCLHEDSSDISYTAHCISFKTVDFQNSYKEDAVIPFLEENGEWKTFNDTITWCPLYAEYTIRQDWSYNCIIVSKKDI